LSEVPLRLSSLVLIFGASRLLGRFHAQVSLLWHIQILWDLNRIC
jgi:hypothetical protein